MKRDLTCAGLLLALAAIFWVAQEEYTEPVDGAMPRLVLIALAVLGLAIGAGALARGRGADEEPAEDATDRESGGASGTATRESTRDTAVDEETATETPRVDWRFLAGGSVLLVAWGVAFGLFGITLSGVVAFVATALLVNRGITTIRRLVIDVAVAVGFVLLCLFVFTRVLYVPLPVSEVLGI